MARRSASRKVPRTRRRYTSSRSISVSAIAAASPASTPCAPSQASSEGRSLASTSGPNTSSAKLRSSASCTPLLELRLRAAVHRLQEAHFAHQLRKRRHVVVALEQHGHGSRAFERPLEQLVYGIDDLRAV